jgi:Holliday junction resolvasome RuvABC endonuclease subunit
VVGAGNAGNRKGKGKIMLHENAVSRDCPTVLALDLGNPFGWAVNIERDIHSDVSLKFSDRKEMQFAGCLEVMIELYKPYRVVFENACFQQGYAAQQWHSQRGILAALCQRYGMRYDGIAVGTIKKHITGIDKFSKPKRKSDPPYLMLEHLAKRGIIVTSHDEADAIGVLLTALEMGVVERAGE